MPSTPDFLPVLPFPDRDALSHGRVGDNWRKRYHALVLHNQVHVNHFPYFPFPPNWPTYIPKDKLAGWFEAYVELMELNYWTGTTFTGGAYDEKDGCWTVELTGEDATIRQLRPKHIVMATSVSGIPNLPRIPTLDKFEGEVIHSGKYTGSLDRAGTNVLIIGTGTSGHHFDARRRRRPLPERKHGGRQPAREQGRT